MFHIRQPANSNPAKILRYSISQGIETLATRPPKRLELGPGGGANIFVPRESIDMYIMDMTGPITAISDLHLVRPKPRHYNSTTRAPNATAVELGKPPLKSPWISGIVRTTY